MSAAERTIQALFIGNSFTHFFSVPRIVAALSEAAGVERPLDPTLETPGGFSFERHWNRPETMQALGKDGWDLVVLQGHSQGMFIHREAMMEYGRRLGSQARARGARLVYYLTWARKEEPAELEAIRGVYEELARRTGGECAPVGVAFERARSERPEIELNWKEGSDHHQSRAGSYLSACVFFATIYDRSPVGLSAEFYAELEGVEELKIRNPFIRLDEAVAQYLQGVAWETVRQFKKP